jgi:hypothetical protein
LNIMITFVFDGGGENQIINFKVQCSNLNDIDAL